MIINTKILENVGLVGDILFGIGGAVYQWGYSVQNEIRDQCDYSSAREVDNGFGFDFMRTSWAHREEINKRVKKRCGNQ